MLLFSHQDLRFFKNKSTELKNKYKYKNLLAAQDILHVVNQQIQSSVTKDKFYFLFDCI